MMQLSTRLIHAAVFSLVLTLALGIAMLILRVHSGLLGVLVLTAFLFSITCFSFVGIGRLVPHLLQARRERQALRRERKKVRLIQQARLTKIEDPSIDLFEA